MTLLVVINQLRSQPSFKGWAQPIKGSSSKRDLSFLPRLSNVPSLIVPLLISAFLRSTTGRAYPDVAAQGQGFQVVVGVRVISVGGTSASSPVRILMMAPENAHVRNCFSADLRRRHIASE